ncbi:MAG: hypothetical protein KBE65_11590 [Phycisphaerae bacterium]|nr:hypothetical protein [Phycisphaerae bacterium]
MHAAELTRAAQRLRHAPWPSAVTQKALKRLTESPSKAALIEDLDRDGSAPVALEILCALELECEQVFQAVRRAIENNAGLCWALVESLNRLPWYGGIRAFLSLEDPPESSPCVYPFYILVRNKLFIPSDMPHELYAYHHRGLWRLLPVARSENWQAPHHSVLAVVGMMVKHLRMPRPDPFVVYLAGLLLGRVCPVESNLDTLHLRAHSDADPDVRTAAHLAMGRIRSLCPAAASGACLPSPPQRRESAVNTPCISAATGATCRP